MSRHAVIAQEKMVPFEEAQERNLLVPLSSIPPAAKLLYVSHRWTAAGHPDTQDANAQMQVRRSKQAASIFSLRTVPVEDSLKQTNKEYDDGI